MAFGGGVLRGQCAEHDAARRPGAVGHVRSSPTAPVGRLTGGGVLAAGHASGALQVVGLALLGLGGAFLLGAKNNPFSLLFTLGGFVVLLLAQAVATRPELIEGIGVRVLGWVNWRAAGPRTPGCASGARRCDNWSR